MRRSTRVSAEISMRVRSLDPGFSFEAECKTLLVNAQGCGFQSPAQLPVGIALVLTIQDRKATATVLNATSLGENSKAWVIGAKLHQSGNFWGLASPPADWYTPPPLPAPTPSGATEGKLAEQVTAEIQRQCEQMMAGLRTEVEKVVDARESDLLTRIAEQASLANREHIRRIAEEESSRLRQAFEEMVRRLRGELEEFTRKQTAAAEERLRELHGQLSASGEERLETLAAEVVEKMNQDAKRLSDSAIAQWHAAFEQTLEMLPELVRENLHRAGATVSPH